VREQVLTDEALDMASVSWHLLISHSVVWSALPILCKSTVVSVNNLILVNFRHKFAAIKTVGVIEESVNRDWVLAVVREDI
jgi:hypothetical protein